MHVYIQREEKRQRRRLKDTKMRREAWRWAVRETERRVSDGEGRKMRVARGREGYRGKRGRGMDGGQK